jgi:hypothetical protein
MRAVRDLARRTNLQEDLRPRAHLAMIPFVSFFWHGAPLSLYEQACMKSFVSRGFEVQLVSYQDDLGQPEGVRLADARQYFPRTLLQEYLDAGGSRGVAAFSDVMRYAVLKTHGGWWCDADVFCLRTADEWRSRFDGADYVLGREAPEQVNGAVLYFAPGAPHGARLLERALAAGRKVRWGAIGPKLLTTYTREAGLADRVQPEQIFYPIGFADDGAADVLLPERRDSCATRVQPSYAFHLWNEFYRRWGLPKSLLPPRGSFLRECIEAEIGDPGCGEYPPELVHTLIAGFAARKTRMKWERVRSALTMKGRGR